MGMTAFQVHISPNFLIESFSKNNGLFNVLCCKYMNDNLASQVNSHICLVVMELLPNGGLQTSMSKRALKVVNLCLSCYVLFIAQRLLTCHVLYG